MDLLNSKLPEKLEIERFRPNIILTGCHAHAEVGNNHAHSFILLVKGEEGVGKGILYLTKVVLIND